MKYPIGVQEFESIRTGGYVYVDKTDLIYRLVSRGKIYFLCRPRRFGKSLLVSTLKCYFEGRRELFEGLAIDKLENEWNSYPVFYLSFGGQNFVEPYQLDHVLEEFVANGEKLYGKDELAQTLGSRFKQVLKNALLLRMISCFAVFIEKETGEGRSDCVVETPKYVYIFEFKRDGKADDAIKQIDKMGYAREYKADTRMIIKIGCNFSSKTGTVDGWKVE